MIRSELCEIAGIAVPTFNSHRRNGDLPFDMSLREAKDGTGRTWARFTIFDATSIIAARQIFAMQGVTWSVAARILRTKDTISTGGQVSAWNNSGPDIHIAQVEFTTIARNDDPFLIPRLQVYNGPLAKILETAEEHVSAFNGRNAPRDQITIGSVAGVNISHCYRIARMNAEALKIDLGSDGAIDPDAVEV